MEVSGQLHPQPLYHEGKIKWWPLNMRLGGLLIQSGHFEEEKTTTLMGIEFLGCPAT
jgi:hypothetical protein